MGYCNTLLSRGIVNMLWPVCSSLFLFFFCFFFSRENTQETKVICNLVTLSNAGWVTAIHSMSRERRVKCDRIAEIYEELHKGCDGNFLMSRHGERNQEWKQNLIIKTWRKHNDIQILDLIKCISSIIIIILV